MIKLLRSISQKEILGINRRNQVYVRPSNPIKARRKADDKLATKKMLSQLNINTPELFKVIRNKKQLKFLDWNSLPKSFVIKPNRGSQGNGIIVFFGKKKGKLEWIRPNGQTMGINELTIHMEKILDGRFSMGNRKDIVLIEDRIQTHPDIKKYSYKGVPDIRLIIYNQVPVMAMIRLPTKRSDGKANLHAGAICAGIDIASGVTTTAMHLRKSALVEDTYEDLEFTIDQKIPLLLRGIQIPFWKEILELSVKCHKASGLGYLGVDVAIDRTHGPVVFELNARPGLGIQIANLTGLRPRLERLEGLEIKSNAHAIRVAKNLFGGEIEEEIESISGKQVVNLVEKVYVYNVVNESKREYISALLDTGITTSRIDEGLASRVGFADAIKKFDLLNVSKDFESFAKAQEFIDTHEKEICLHPHIIRLAKVTELEKITVRPVIEATIKIAGTKRSFEAILGSQREMIYPMLIGRSNLKEYLIDASKTFAK